MSIKRVAHPVWAFLVVFNFHVYFIFILLAFLVRIRTQRTCLKINLFSDCDLHFEASFVFLLLNQLTYGHKTLLCKFFKENIQKNLTDDVKFNMKENFYMKNAIKQIILIQFPEQIYISRTYHVNFSCFDKKHIYAGEAILYHET